MSSNLAGVQTKEGEAGKVTQTEAMQMARQHMEAAFHVLHDNGIDGARAYEYLMGIILTVWAHTQGLVTHAVLAAVGS
jgi:hypothetical protein